MLANDLAVGQYFVTGNLTKELFADDCRFKDPTNDIVGLARYVKVFSPSAHSPQHSPSIYFLMPLGVSIQLVHLFGRNLRRYARMEAYTQLE
jgi:hypothetical protein